MLRNDLFAVSFVTGYLFLYCILVNIEQTLNYAFLMFLFSPVLIIWMVYTVIKHGRYDGRELGNREFGYQDKEDNAS